ncbi:MAG: hypothetical protein K8H88_07365, partial [Sandaracinaceae bacterium]|nr:hypothetical protein [Sandaracinaceae bacterium]
DSSTVLVVRDRRPFYIDDGSGVCARVETGEGQPMIAASHVYGPPTSTVVIGGTPDTRGPITVELAGWLRSKGIGTGEVIVTETLLAPGDRVFAIGPCGWQSSSWQGREPVLRNLGKGEQELLLSNLDESRLLALYGTRRKVRRVLLAIALGILATGVVAMAVGLASSLDVIRSFELPLK